jgi:hypothetical protein
MQKHKLRSLLAGAATLSAVALAATLVLGTGAASAAVPPDPAGGAVPVAPHFYNGNVEGIRSSGSDTTFFMMQKISDLYTGAGLYGCTLNSGAGQTLYNSTDPASSTGNEEYYCLSGQNAPTTDVNDNWDRTEITTGVDDVGSGAGQNQLCNSTPSPLPIDFARSSKPIANPPACATEVETGYAKDGVPAIAYPVNPSTYGSSTFSSSYVLNPGGPTFPGYSTVNGGNIGPVAEGWLPGDPVAGPYNGTSLQDISNVDNGGGANSTAYRLWCATGTNRIDDWGQLTNLGPNLELVDATTSNGSSTVTFPTTVTSDVVGGGVDGVSGPGIQSGTTVSSVSGNDIVLSQTATASATVTLIVDISTTLAEGQGVPIGLAIRVMGVNTSSGTEATWSLFAEAGVSGGGCSSNMNTNAANDPNSATAPSPNSAHVALENNSDQLDQFAISDFPTPDYVDQAIEVATSLYIESNGVYNTNPYAGASTIDGTSYAGIKIDLNLYTSGPNTGNPIPPSTANLESNTFPTARTLFNIYNSSTVRASTGGFLNWICDGNVNFQKGLDNSTGKNFDTEVNTAIVTTYGFPRLTDETPAVAIGTPADNQAAPNNTCSANLSVVTTSGSSTITLPGAGSFPPDITNAGSLPAPYDNVSVVGTGIPTGDYVSSGGGTTTLTLNAPATASGTVTVDFLGVPPVTAVASPQT